MILAINKPRGMTSHDVVNHVRRATSERRVGHAGTLDPLASGVLIVLIGRDATKRQSEFMQMPKVYEAGLTFGFESTTYDAEGLLTRIATIDALKQLSKKNIEMILPKFIGTIQQKVPAYSAVKRGGEPLYKKARRGMLTPSDIPTRDVTIDEITLLTFTAGAIPVARLRVACHSGTYIRSLAHDIGKTLGIGAYLSDLVRTAIGPYGIEQAKDVNAI